MKKKGTNSAAMKTGEGEVGGNLVLDRRKGKGKRRKLQGGRRESDDPTPPPYHPPTTTPVGPPGVLSFRLLPHPLFSLMPYILLYLRTPIPAVDVLTQILPIKRATARVLPGREEQAYSKNTAYPHVPGSRGPARRHRTQGCSP